MAFKWLSEYEYEYVDTDTDGMDRFMYNTYNDSKRDVAPNG